MPIILSEVDQIKIKQTTFNLANLAGFPYLTYQSQRQFYLQMKNWYDGTVFDESTKDDEGNEVFIYPVKINPIKGTVQKHTSVLMGQSQDSIRLGGIPVRFVPDVKDKDQKARISEALMTVYKDSGGGALFVQNAMLSQYLGGSVMTAKWRADLNDGKGALEIDAPHPSEFVAITDGSNYWRFKEAWVVRNILANQLQAYGLDKSQFVEGTTNYWYIEHYTPDRIEVTINDVPVRDKLGNEFSSVNPFGVVPVMYIPHIRTDNFYGETLITNAVMGILKELNMRTADIGDAVSDDSHVIVGIVNSRKTPGVIKVNGRNIADFGSALASIATGGSDSTPNLLSVKTNSTSKPMLEFVDKLMSLYRIEVFHPSVADGEDSGSQRSSKTLDARMWSLESHVELERIFWTVGLMFFNKILLKMMAVKKLFGITEADVNVSLIVQWQPKLPRDRNEIVLEAVARAGAHLGSIERLMEIIGDIPDPEGEFQKIIEELLKITATMPAPTPFGGGAAGDNKGGGNADKKGAPPVKKDQKAITPKKENGGGG